MHGLSLRESYTLIQRNSAELVTSKMAGECVLASLHEHPQRQVDVLAELVKFKFHRQGICHSKVQKLQQELSLATLKKYCEPSDDHYMALISLARNRSTLFGMRAIPATLKRFLLDLDDDRKKALATKIGEQAVRFLARSGITLPTVEENEQVILPHFDSGHDFLGGRQSSFPGMDGHRPYFSELPCRHSFEELPAPSIPVERSFDRRLSLDTRIVCAAKAQGFKKIQDGDYFGFGSLFILGQTHYVDGIERNPAEKSEVEQSQRKIFDCLTDLKVKKIYLEGFVEGDDQFDPTSTEPIKKIFASYHPKKSLTDKQRNCLLAGGAYTYAALNDDVVLYPTSSKTTAFYLCSDMLPMDIDVARDGLGGQESENSDFQPLVPGWTKSQQKFLVDRREAEMTRYILGELDGRDEAALVVGMAHQFNDGFHQQGRRPVVYRKDFD